jgi:hypothetical protein
MGFFGDLAKKATGFLPGGEIIQSGIDILPGGGGSGSTCPGSPSLQSVSNMLRNLTSSERRALEAAHNEANPGKAFPFTDPATLTKRAMGGSDCKASSSSGKRFKSLFLDLTARKGGFAADLSSSPSGGGGSVQGPEGFPTDAEQVTLGNLILDPIKNVLRNIFVGAAQGAGAAAQSAEDASGRTNIRNAIITSPITVALVLGVVILAVVSFIRRRK